MNNQEIVAKLWNLCNVLRDDGITYHQYVTELTYILFLKMCKETGSEDAIPEAYRWDSLTSRSGLDLKKHYIALLSYLGENCTGRVREIYQGAQTNIDEPKNLEKIIKSIDQFDWFTAKEEGLGNLYEGLLEKNANEKKSGAGQYFTPRVLIGVMTRLIAPQPGELCNDPACGTFGFMIAADAYVKAHTDDLFELSIEEQEFQKKRAFTGCELVHDTHRLALMNAMLHDIECPIYLGDTLSSFGTQFKGYDVVLTNPPFGTKKGGERATRDDLTFPTSNKQLNFLQHIYRSLNKSGHARAAVVLPDNVLFADGDGERIRRDLIEPCFLLYFTGKTGTRKTTMAKLFLNFFGMFDNGTAPPAGFRDTANAVEKKFALTDSTLVLLDDRIPSTTPKIKVQMESMEQSVARQIGDRSGRARMNADGTLKATYRPKCNLIITAEESFSNVGESAIARALSVELFPGDIDLEALTEVQANAVHLNECMGDYIQFVIQHWDNLKAELKPLFMELRSKAQTGAHGRLAECVAHLQIGITVMCKWLCSIEQISTAEAEDIQSRAWSVFMALSEEQNRRITEEKPVKLFVDAIREMIDRGTIRFVDLTTNQGDYTDIRKMGYKDGDFYYCFPDAIYSAVRRYYSDQDKNFPLGKSAIFQQLAIDGMIETDKTQTTKTKRIGDKRPRFLWLKSSTIEREEETENGQR